ncbi:MAG: DUF1311 domain-containing protein [Lachnospiraceae bacterium]|jgi:uncharacterized protein YecT (DUF1311 family)|nr:DUF1311 domain-containing protein [Lachnospiraceae bacterium]
MKKKCLLAVLMMAVMMTGCTAARSTGNADDAVTEQKADGEAQDEEAVEAENVEVNETPENADESLKSETSDPEEVSDPEEAKEAGASDGQTDEVMKAVEAAAKAGSLQEELSGIEEAEASYAAQMRSAQTQVEMTEMSQKPELLWDTELNSLWSRAQETLEESELEILTKEQKVWPSIKDKMAEEAVKDFKEGSIYGQLLFGELTAITRTRAYVLAQELAQAKGETFELPERNECGKYVNLEDTEEVKDFLIVTESMESGYTGMVSVEGIGKLEGSVVKNGEELMFTSYDEVVKAKIAADWSGAVFEVLEAKEGPFTNGEIYEFPVVIQ